MPTSDWRRRHAIQIVAQLPESRADALAVLAFARELVDGFLAAREPDVPDHTDGVLLPFPADPGAKRTAS